MIYDDPYHKHTTLLALLAKLDVITVDQYFNTQWQYPPYF